MSVPTSDGGASCFVLPARLATAAAATTARTTGTARATPTATTTSAAFGARTRLVHRQRPTFELALIQAIDCALRVVIRPHLDERKSARTARGLVAHDANRFHGAKGCKQLLELGLSRRVGQVANK
jgi:hypothetical protein